MRSRKVRGRGRAPPARGTVHPARPPFASASGAAGGEGVGRQQTMTAAPQGTAWLARKPRLSRTSAPDTVVQNLQPAGARVCPIDQADGRCRWAVQRRQHSAARQVGHTAVPLPAAAGRRCAAERLPPATVSTGASALPAATRAQGTGWPPHLWERLHRPRWEGSPMKVPPCSAIATQLQQQPLGTQSATSSASTGRVRTRGQATPTLAGATRAACPVLVGTRSRTAQPPSD